MMNSKKDVLEMDKQELYNNRRLLTEEGKIKLKTSPRKNHTNFPDGNIYYCDALSLEPKKYYNFCVKLITQSSTKKMSATFRIMHGKGTIAMGESKSKGAVFWFFNEYKCFKFIVNTNIGKVNIGYAFVDYDHRGQKIVVENGIYDAMGMKIEEISENKKIYHCTDYGLPADFEKFVFSVEWNLIEKI